MEFDAFNHWIMLRPLFAFIMALPTLIAALLIGSRRERRNKGEPRETAAPHAGVLPTDVDRPKLQPDASVRQQPAAAAAGIPSSRSATPRVEQPAADVETARSAAAMPREWDGAPLRPNWNRQVRLGGGRSGGGLR